jgi:nitroreductase
MTEPADRAVPDAFDVLMTTRAIRRFSGRPVAAADIERCLAAAQQAPSGGNVQPQQYLVLTEPETRATASRWYRAAFDRYDATLPSGDDIADEAARNSWQRTRAASRHLAEHLEQVPVIVLFLQPLIPWTPADDQGPLDIGRLDASVYPAVQNFCLAARALGLGTALTTVVRIHGAELLSELGVPAGRFEIAALVPVGYPTGRFGVAPRRPAWRSTHWDRWGERHEPPRP